MSLLATISASVSRAEIIATDDFEYDAANIHNGNGGTGWMDSWTGWNQIHPGSLAVPDYDAKGNHLTTLGDTKGTSDAFKCSFRTPDIQGREHLTVDGKFGKPGTTIWIAFLASVPRDRSSPGGFGGLSLFDERREQLFLGDSGSTNLWGFERSGQLQRFSAVEADTNVTFLVYKIQFQMRNAQVEMWVNPKPGDSDPPVRDTVAAEVVRGFQFTRVRISSAPAPLQVDGLRLGTTYADVAPCVKKP